MNPTATKLEEAILIAVKAHMGQKSITTGLPYILHSLKVMNRVRRAGGDEDAMIVAVLHDVFAMTDLKMDVGFVEKFGSRVIDSLVILTPVLGVNYTDRITLIGNNKNRDLTVMVELANIADDLEQGKSNPLPQPQQSRLTSRYKEAQKYLMNVPKEITEC